MNKQFVRIYAGIVAVLFLSAVGFLAMSKQWVATVRQADFEDKTHALIAMIREELAVVTSDPVQQLLVLNMFSLTHRMPITLESLIFLPLSSEEKKQLHEGDVVTIGVEERFRTYAMAPEGDVIVLGPYLPAEMIRWQNNLIEERSGWQENLLFGNNQGLFNEIDVFFFCILGAILVGIGAAIYFLIRPLERRIYALSDAAERFGKGDLSRRAQVQEGNAVADLAHSFNGMANRIEDLVEGQRELLRAVSHELRTPLARVFFLLNNLKNAKEGRDSNIERIERSMYELNELVEELMDFARLDSRQDLSDRREIDVYAEAWELPDLVMELENTLSIHIDCEHVKIRANAKHFKRALTNLVTNAIRHATSEIWVRGKKAGAMVHICVEDDGAGIPENLRERVFEPFYRVDESRSTTIGGTGLGLAIVKRIVMQHDGNVVVEESVHGGAKFTLIFPILEQMTVSEDSLV